MATFTVRPEGIIRQPALTMPGNATGSEAACTSLTASQIRTLLGLGTTSDVTFDIVRATTSVQTPLVNNASAALTLGNATYGVTVPGAATFSGSLSTASPLNVTHATQPTINLLKAGDVADSDGMSILVASNNAYVWNRENGSLFLGTANATQATIQSGSFSMAGSITAIGDISMSKTSAQGYIRAYATDGVKNVAISHNGANGAFTTSSGANTFFSGTGQHYFFDSTGSKYLVITQSGNAATITSIASAASYLQIVTESGQLNVTSNGVANSTFNVFSGTGGRYTTLTHDGTNGILSTSSGNLNLVPTGGTVAVTGGITASGVVSHGAYTVATLPAAGSNAGKMAQVTDSNVAASGNYGATVAAGGANRVKVFSDGTNWVIA